MIKLKHQSLEKTKNVSQEDTLLYNVIIFFYDIFFVYISFRKFSCYVLLFDIFRGYNKPGYFYLNIGKLVTIVVYLVFTEIESQLDSFNDAINDNIDGIKTLSNNVSILYRIVYINFFKK